MESYGNLLRKTREEKNLDLVKISREISIEKRYLEGLENEDSTVFPGEAYLVGFLKNYSNYLELDTDFVLKLYHNKQIQESPLPEGLYGKKSSKRILPFLIPITIFVVFVATISILLLRQNNKNNDTLCNCFFSNFSPETYNSHIILSLNDNQQITESDFIKNSAVMSIKSKPPLITKGDFSSIKKTFTSEADSIISSIQSLSSNNKISNDKIFSTLGAQDRIYYQPFLSLKYNKVSASYKNYTVNYVNFTDNNNTIDDSSFISKFNKINPLCKIFSVNDSYYHIDNTYIKCRNCNKKLYGKISNERGIILTDQYSFYICPITKNIFCVDCEPNIRND